MVSFSLSSTLPAPEGEVCSLLAMPGCSFASCRHLCPLPWCRGGSEQPIPDGSPLGACGWSSQAWLEHRSAFTIQHCPCLCLAECRRGPCRVLRRNLHSCSNSEIPQPQIHSFPVAPEGEESISDLKAVSPLKQTLFPSLCLI